MGTTPLKPFDVVILPNGVPDEGVAPGTRAVIMEVHTVPSLAYEVEVADDLTGATTWWGSVRHEDVQAVEEA